MANSQDDSDDSKASRLKIIRDDIKTGGTRSTWLLGLLVLIILAVASFLFQNYNEETELYSRAWIIEGVATFFFIYYSTILAIYMRPLVVPNFTDIDKDNEAEMQDKLDNLTDDLKALTYLFIFPLPFVSCFAFWLFY